jgi:hypothetical protein
MMRADTYTVFLRCVMTGRLQLLLYWWPGLTNVRGGLLQPLRRDIEAALRDIEQCHNQAAI